MDMDMELVEHGVEIEVETPNAAGLGVPLGVALGCPVRGALNPNPKPKPKPS
jgi:hypothetical protein